MSTSAATPDYAQLAERIKRRDQDAFSAVVRALQEPLYYSVLRMIGHSSDARDIVQRTFLKAWSNIDKLEKSGALRSWIFSIGLNLARNHLRDRGGRVYEPVEDQAQLAVAPVASAALVRQEEKLRLRACLEKLPPKQREVITLRIDSELSFKEIAGVVGCSEGSARVNFHHGLKRLRQEMGEEGSR